MSNRLFEKLKSNDPTKYPARMGKPWQTDEDQQLLNEIQKKIPIEMIAELHERTEGGITSHLRSIAADYHYHNQMPLEKIQKYTGLSMEVIVDAISKRKFQAQKELKKAAQKQARLPQNSLVSQEKESDTKVIISLLREIKALLERSA